MPVFMTRAMLVARSMLLATSHLAPEPFPAAAVAAAVAHTPGTHHTRSPAHLFQAFFVTFHFDSETIIGLDKPNFTNYFFCHLFCYSL
jgi:hypothetical protein